MIDIDNQAQVDANYALSAAALPVFTANPRDGDDKDVPLKVLPPGYTIVDLECHLTKPTRIRQTLRFQETASMVAYLLRFNAGKTALFANPDKPEILGILDYHGSADSPEWGKHKAVLTPQYTPEYLAWAGKHGKWQEQVPFGEFLEERIDDIREPDGAKVLEGALNLKEKRVVTFQSTQKLANGTRSYAYEEKAENAGKNALTLPESLILRFPIFQGEDPLDLTALLRYDISSGAVKFKLHLQQAQERVRDAFRAIVERIEKAADLKAYIGSAE